MFEHLQAGRIEQRPASRIDLIAGVEKMPASLQHAREPLDIKRNDQPRTGKATSQSRTEMRISVSALFDRRQTTMPEQCRYRAVAGGLLPVGSADPGYHELLKARDRLLLELPCGRSLDVAIGRDEAGVIENRPCRAQVAARSQIMLRGDAAA